jgi:Sec-independent protein translocase protein TatA
MDSIFGIGIPELVLILIIAGLILGPKQIQAVSRSLGRVVGMIRGMTGDIRNIARTLSAELDGIEDIKEAKRDLLSLQKQLGELQREFDHAKRELLTESKSAVKDFEQAISDATGKVTAVAVSDSIPEVDEAQDKANAAIGANAQNELEIAARYPENGNSIAPPQTVSEPEVVVVDSNSAEITIPNRIAVPDDEE